MPSFFRPCVAVGLTTLLPIGAFASSLDFLFSFTNGPQNGGGLVTGVVRGLIDNTSSLATSVEVLSNTSGFGVGEYNVGVDQNWIVSGGSITSYSYFYGSRGPTPTSDCCFLSFSFTNSPGFEYAELEEAGGPADVDADPFSVGDLTFTPVPLPAAVFLFAGALGGLGLMRRRKKT